MADKKLGRGITLAGKVPVIHSTPTALADDETNAAVQIENVRYERAILDFESEIRRRRE